MQQILGSRQLTNHGHFLTMLTQKSLNLLLAFLNLYQHARNYFIPSVHFWDTSQFYSYITRLATPFLTMPTQTIFDQLLIYVNLYQHTKNHFVHLCTLHTLNFRAQSPDWSHPFLTMPTLKILNHLLICMNFYQCRKSVSSICSFLRYSQF